MNILPQILNYDTKNFIINHIIDNIKHNLNDFIYNEKEASFGLLNRSSKVLPTVYSGNPISLLLNSIAN